MENLNKLFIKEYFEARKDGLDKDQAAEYAHSCVAIKLEEYSRNIRELLQDTEDDTDESTNDNA